MKKVYLIICLLLSNYSYSQNKNDETQELINNLSWNSFEFVINYGTSLVLDENSKKLISLGKDISKELLSELKNEEKSVIIHMILTNIWEPELFFWKTCYQNKLEDNFNHIEYSLNNLSWYNFKDKLSVDPYEVNRIYNYWSKRIK